MLDLEHLYNALPIPEGQESGRFLALPIPGYEMHRVGRDTRGHACLLIGAADEVRGRRLPPIVLERLAVQHDMLCSITTPDTAANGSSERFTVIRCLDQGLTRYFLQVAAVVVQALGEAPLRSEVSEVVSKLAELFQAASQPPRKSVLGLWAELYIIAEAHDPAALVQAWHVYPEELYDFAVGAQRLEVKCAGGAQRTHHFSLEQLHPRGDVQVLVASLMTSRAVGGVSLADLIDQIRERLAGKPELVLGVERVVAAMLGNALSRGLEERFDLEQARSTLAYYWPYNIPSVSPDLPARVRAVRFIADLTDTEPADQAQVAEAGGLFTALPLEAYHEQDLQTRR